MDMLASKVVQPATKAFHNKHARDRGLSFILELEAGICKPSASLSNNSSFGFLFPADEFSAVIIGWFRGRNRMVDRVCGNQENP